MIYKQIAQCVEGLPTSGYHSDNPLNTAVAAVKDFIAAYNALAPDWSEAPEWAQWYSIYSDGYATWSGDGVGKLAGLVELPLGIDYRLCKWQRPEVQP